MIPKENELINARMKKHNFNNFNTYARYMLLTGEVITIDYSELINLKIEINRIGTNINQIVKHINTNEEISSENYRLLQESLSEIKSLLDDSFSKEITKVERFLKERE